MLVIRARTASPFLTTSLGCLMRLVQLMSETWIRPSISSVISTKAPNSVRLRTLPSMTVPTGWVSRSSSQGLRSTWRSDSEMRRCCMSSSETMASTSSPTLRILEGLTTFLVHDISQTWIRPSTPVLELDEGAVVDQADHLAVHPRAHRVLLVDQHPGVLGALLVAERDALGLAVELEHRDLDLVAHREVLGGVVDPAPGDVGDVEQAVDAAEVDEHAVVGDVLDHARRAPRPRAAGRGSRPSSSRTPSRAPPCATARCCCAGGRG